jgi:prophage regulatory protein
MTTRKRVMRISDVEQATGLNKRTIYRYIQANQFPQPFRVGMRASGWWESEVDAWIENCAKQRHRAPHMEGGTWVYYKDHREYGDVQVGDTCGDVPVERVEYRGVNA